MGEQPMSQSEYHNLATPTVRGIAPFWCVLASLAIILGVIRVAALVTESGIFRFDLTLPIHVAPALLAIFGTIRNNTKTRKWMTTTPPKNDDVTINFPNGFGNHRLDFDVVGIKMEQEINQ